MHNGWRCLSRVHNIVVSDALYHHHPFERYEFTPIRLAADYHVPFIGLAWGHDWNG